MRYAALVVLVAASCMISCGEVPENVDPEGDAEAGDAAPGDSAPCDESTLPYATEVVAFTPGQNAGFGSENMPDVALGPPVSHGPAQGSLDVVSLGVGGEIVLGFSPREIIDGPGFDIVVFENAFWVGGDSNNPFAELGEVSVSADGIEWYGWTCDTTPEKAPWPGCAGWQPALEYNACTLLPLDVARSGGAGFDLSDLELSIEAVRYVRIRDLSTAGGAPSAGFDVDAVGLVNWRTF